tara:strand:- start:710 stop:1138 length:429 start_codon:yes stop_codon:yes gene_type:complete
MRKLMSLISILLLVGCSLEPTAIYNFELELGLEQDGNGYYHLPMDSQGASNQSLYKFAVDTNNPNIQLVHWVSDTYFDVDYFGYTESAPIINGSSYTYGDGMAYTMFGPHMEQIGDTVAVLVGYTDSHTFECYVLNFEIILD